MTIKDNLKQIDKKIKVVHIFLSGAVIWCSKIPHILLNDVGDIGDYFEHSFVCNPNEIEFKNIFPQVIIDEEIQYCKRFGTLAPHFLTKYAEITDYIFLYNNVFTPLDRARISKKVLKKLVWISFGSDLGQERQSGWVGSSLLSKFYHSTVYRLIEKISRKKMAQIVAIGSVDIFNGYMIRRDYGELPIIPFGISVNTYNAKKQNNLPRRTRQQETLRIMIGHHGYPGVYHEKYLKKILKYKEEDIIVSLPMAYGNKEYISYIEDIAYEMFGSKVEVIKNMMSYEEYVEYIKGVDIAIFPSRNLIAQGNIGLLSFYGKKLYLDVEGKIAEKLRLNGIETFDIYDIGKISFAEFSKDTNEENKKWMEEFGRSVLIDRTVEEINMRVTNDIKLGLKMILYYYKKGRQI